MQYAFRLDSELMRRVDELGKKDMRNRTNMVEYILADYVRRSDPSFEPAPEPAPFNDLA